MKISQLLVSILVLAASGTLVYVSGQQQKAMHIVTYTHGGGETSANTSATGLRSYNSELVTTDAQVSGQRADADKKTGSALTDANDQRNKLSDAERALQAKQDERTSLEAELEKQKSDASVGSWVADSQAAANGNADLLAVIDMCSSETPEYDEAVEKLGEIYKAQGEEAEALQKTLSKVTDEQTAAEEELKRLQAELARLNEINDRFFREYTKNGQEFTIDGADANWKYVTLRVGADSGLVKGDALLVKRGSTIITVLHITEIKNGEVTAEFDADALPAGIRPAVGDRAFRLKPLGN